MEGMGGWMGEVWRSVAECDVEVVEVRVRG